MTERISFSRAISGGLFLALVATLLPIATVQAASTGLTLNEATLTTPVDTQVNFVASATNDDGVATPDTVVSMTDNGGGGSFFTGTATGGNCNSVTPDPDNQFDITFNKGICYSNATAGTYTITVSLLSSTSVQIGASAEVAITVEAAPAQNPELLALISGLTATATALQSQTGDTDPLPTVDPSDSDAELQILISTLLAKIAELEASAAQNATTTDDTASSTDDTASSTDDGSDTASSTATSTDSTASTTDDQAGNGSDDADSHGGATDPCEFEGHKYDAEGNPLEGWQMGLIKVITYEGGVDVYTIATDVTDIDGFFCLRWGDDWSPAFDINNYPNGYTFEYRVYETKQTDWEFVSAEHGADYANLDVATLDQITFTETQVQVMVGEANGYVIADAEYHVDFYNMFTGETATNTGTTTGGNGTTTVSQGGGGGSVNTGDGDDNEGGSSSSGTRVTSRTTPAPTVAGISDTPEPLVLGEQVDAVPLGGANTGAGGTAAGSSATAIVLLLALATALQARRFVNA